MKGESANGSRSRWVALVVPLCAASALGACAARPPARPAPTKTAAPANAPTMSAANDVQCHMEKLTGSLLATRVCMTAAQREKIRQSVQDARDSMNKSLVPPDCPSAGSCH